MSSQWVTLTRDCDAIQVPHGNTITARSGTRLSIVHQLGDTYTVRTEHGYLLRIDGHDADALGLANKAAVLEPTEPPKAVGPVDEAYLWEQLRTVYDPEIPANIVELGLIYECNIAPLPDGTQRVDVKMTLTAPGCGMGQVLKEDVERKLGAAPNVSVVEVELVFSPPWDPTMMSEAARLQLGMM